MAEEKKKSNLKIIIIIIAVLLALGGGVFGGVYLYMTKNAEPAEVIIVEGYKEVGEIMVNLSDKEAKRYVKLTATVTYDSADEELGTEIDTKLVALKDTMIFYLKSLKSTDFTADNEMILKSELVDKLNQNLTKGLLIDVKFNELLVQ